MMTRPKYLPAVYLPALAFALLLLLPTTQLRAADHLDAPILQQAGMGDRDINDLYAFQSPANPNNTVLIMTVNPFAGVMNPAGTTSPMTFGTDVEYQIEIDNDGDAVPDITYSTTFGLAAGGVQSLSVNKNGNPFAAGSTGVNNIIATGGNVTAGLYDDPFFFDLVGFNNGLAFTGDDTFAGANVSAIVLEVPSSELNGATSNIGVTARTVVGGNQVDRMGRPAINTVLIPSARKDEFNEADEANDFTAFGTDVNAAITGLSNQANADVLTPILLPDVLTFDTADASGFLNGRRLADDVIDAELTLLTGSPTPIGDGVDANDRAFLDVFPYLASPNPIPEPSTIVLAVLAFPAIGSCLRRRRNRCW